MNPVLPDNTKTNKMGKHGVEKISGGGRAG